MTLQDARWSYRNASEHGTIDQAHAALDILLKLETRAKFAPMFIRDSQLVGSPR